MKNDTITFKAKKVSDYANIRLRFPKLDLSRNPVLQFVQSDKVVDSVILTSREYRNPMIKPGDYDLRILYDRNKNGIWDPGVFFGKHLQPEKVFLIPEVLKAKANFEMDKRYDF